MNNKKRFRFFIIIITIIIVLLCGIIMLFSVKKQYEPAIKYGEFPFSLIYKIDDKTITVNNTYICEFTGIGWDTGRGFYRKWNGYIKETRLENVLIFEDSERKLFCQMGDPLYYMSDDKYLSWENKALSPPHLYIVKKSDGIDLTSVDEIKQTYNIEIISWQFSEPIENSFKK